MNKMPGLRSIVAAGLAIGVIAGNIVSALPAHAGGDGNFIIDYNGSPTTGSWQEDVTLTSVVYEYSGDPIDPGYQPQTGEALRFSLRRGSHQQQLLCSSAITDNNGVATCRAQITASPGSYDVRVELDRVNGDPISWIDVPFTVKPGPLFTSVVLPGAAGSSDGLPACHGTGSARHCPILPK